MAYKFIIIVIILTDIQYVLYVLYVLYMYSRLGVRVKYTRMQFNRYMYKLYNDSLIKETAVIL